MRKTGIIKFSRENISDETGSRDHSGFTGLLKSHNALNALHELRFGHVGPPTNNTCTNTVLSFSAVLRFVYKFEGTVSYLRDLLSHHSITQVGNANLSPNIGNSFVHKHKSVCSAITF